MITVPFTGSLAAQRKIRTLRRIDIAENAGTAAVARALLRDTDQNGSVLADIRIAAGDSRHIDFGQPIFFPGGLYIQVSAGTVRGSVTGE
jgi:hypothetical protein